MNVSIEILTASFLKLHITFCYLGDERNRNMNNRDKKKNNHELPALAMRCSFSILNPTWCGKIRRFGTIEAMIEASMIAKRKCDHEFAGLLCNFIERYLIFA